WLTGERFTLALEELVVIQRTMAAFAINTMQFQFVAKMRTRHETLQLRDAHLLHILENHVLSDGLDGCVDLFAGEAKARHDRLGHDGTDLVMSTEANPLLDRIKTVSRWFAD